MQSGHDSPLCQLLPASPAWFAWLEEIGSFAFSSREGNHCTLLKERVQRSVYWYAYRTQQGKTRKRYVGRTIDLSLARLEQISALLAKKAPVLQVTPSPNTAQANILPASISSPSLSTQQVLEPLLFSKVQPPRLPVHLLPRPRLFSLFDAARSYKLTLVQAPTGYGKTTALCQWMERRPAAPVAWVSLDPDDNDPLRFCQSLIAACQSLQSGLGRMALALLASARQPPFPQPHLETVLTLLLNDLAGLKENRLLLLDDYHVITSPRIHQTLTFFLEHLPPALSLIVLTRHEPPLPLLRWRVGGELSEVHTATLRFSLEETALFLRQILPIELSDETCEHIDAKLEGWPAGLRLLGLMQPHLGSQGIEQHLALLDESKNRSGFQHTLADYLITEVLHGQPETLQRFLLQTSMLICLTGPLCDHLMGEHNSAALLQESERAGLFLEALDQSGHWYRYHSLWAFALQTEAARRLGAEMLGRLSQQASLWYEQHGMLREAIEMALRGFDAERTATLIEQLSETEALASPGLIVRWLEQIPEAVLRLHPALCFRAALALRAIQREDQGTAPGGIRAEMLLQLAEEGWQRAGNTARLGEVFALHALNAWQMERISQAADAARQALAVLPGKQGDYRESTVTGMRRDAREWRCICQCIEGVEMMYEGKHDRAWSMLLKALEGSSGPFRRVITILLGVVSHGLGELQQASAYLQEVLAQGREQNDWQDVAYALLNLARLSYEWNDLDTCEQHLQEVLVLEAPHHHPDLRESATFQLALIQAARGQIGDAQCQLTAQLTRLLGIPLPSALRLRADVESWLFHYALVTGDFPAAQHALASLLAYGHKLSPLYRDRLLVLKARLLFAQGESQAAFHLLVSQWHRLQPDRRICEMIELEALLALCSSPGNQQEARRWLEQALSRACYEGFVRIFLDAGEPLARLLRELLPRLEPKRLRDYARVILRARVASEEPGSFPSPSAYLLLEPLSPQEQRILQKLCVGCTNAEIAHALVISVNTVKDHLKHLYRKLGVRNRLEACEAGHHLNLL